MVEITLVEIHLEDAQFDADAEAIANAPLSGLRSLFGRGETGTESADDRETTPSVADDSSTGDGGKPSVGKLLLLGLAVAVLAIAVRRLIGDDGTSVIVEEEPEIAEIDVGE